MARSSQTTTSPSDPIGTADDGRHGVMALVRSAATPHTTMALAAVSAPRRSPEGPSPSRHTRDRQMVSINEPGRIPLNQPAR